MPPSLYNTRRIALMKRALFKTSLGGIENNPEVHGNGNEINFHGSPKEKEATFVHQTFTEAGKLLKAGTNLITAPVKWIEHMQENWCAIIYTVCKPILFGHRPFIGCFEIRHASNSKHSY